MIIMKRDLVGQSTHRHAVPIAEYEHLGGDSTRQHGSVLIIHYGARRVPHGRRIMSPDAAYVRVLLYLCKRHA
jgi:hypothetical protein